MWFKIGTRTHTDNSVMSQAYLFFLLRKKERKKKKDAKYVTLNQLVSIHHQFSKLFG